MYIKSIEITQEYRNLQPKIINFKEGLNFIIGDNGKGKTTLLNMLNLNNFNNGDLCYKNIRKICLNILPKDGINIYYFDSEKMNPATIHDLDLAPDPKYAMLSHFQSHGETLFPIIKSITTAKNSIILLDEPENGISLKNQIILLTALKKSVKNKNQLFIATHSYIFINNSKEVFDIENFNWINSQEYLNTLRK